MSRLRILLATDAWAPQVNGVVRTLAATVQCLRRFGHDVEVVTSEGLRTVALPSYPEIRLAVRPGRAVRERIERYRPDAIHISTEGPIGWAARRACLDRGLAFTTAYHTRFPEYVAARVHLPAALFYPPVRRFHGKASGVMVATPALKRELELRGFHNLRDWSRGVDTELFRPAADRGHPWTGPVFLYAGRVAVEKNIEAFLALDLPGTKVVVGDGPARAALMRRYPGVVFAGIQHGEALVSYYQRADVFVFPSRTDTFGLVMLEAMACGTPVAAFPVSGPVDVIDDAAAGVLHEDLREACLRALRLDREEVRAVAMCHSWAACTRQFVGNLVLARSGHLRDAA
jgi:glycosyltransferase involved in cell wall biosynthesis